MSDIDDSVYASSPFQFLVEGKKFYIHAALVSRHSKPLDRMMNIGMSEAKAGCAVLEEVEQGTFARFAEWAYQGYYTPGEYFCERDVVSSSEDGAVKKEEPPPLPEEPDFVDDAPAPEEPDLTDEPGLDVEYLLYKSQRNCPDIRASIPKIKKSSRLQLKEEFIERQTTVRKESIGIPPPRPNCEPNENYTDVFLSHAKVYVFAEMYDIQPLRKLALENLQSVLAIFTLYPERTGDIIATLRYVYDKTSEVVPGSGDDLRLLLSHYVGYEMDTLLQDDNLRTLMIEDGRAFLGDFLKLVAKRIE